MPVFPALTVYAAVFALVLANTRSAGGYRSNRELAAAAPTHKAAREQAAAKYRQSVPGTTPVRRPWRPVLQPRKEGQWPKSGVGARSCGQCRSAEPGPSRRGGTAVPRSHRPSPVGCADRGVACSSRRWVSSQRSSAVRTVLMLPGVVMRAPGDLASKTLSERSAGQSSALFSAITVAATDCALLDDW